MEQKRAMIAAASELRFTWKSFDQPQKRQVP